LTLCSLIEIQPSFFNLIKLMLSYVCVIVFCALYSQKTAVAWMIKAVLCLLESVMYLQ